MNDPAAPGPGSPADASPYRQLWDAAGQLALVDGVFAGVGGVYLTTRSATVTFVATAAAVVSAWLAGRRAA